MTSYQSIARQIMCCNAPVLTGVLALAIGASTPAAAQQTEGVQPTVHELVAPKVQESDLSQITSRSLAPAWAEGEPVRVIEDMKEAAEGAGQPVEGPEVTRAFEEQAAAPIAGVTFDGIPATGSLPPDTVGDVGPKHYVQAVNTVLAVYDKLGNLLAGPTPINALWSGFGGPCETQNNGDPVVRYDHLADRWLVAQFAIPGGQQGLHECIAISRTPDPVSGGWFLYDFPTVDAATGKPVFPDYPKIGVWADGYYMGTQRGFPNGGLDVWSFERDKMLVGAAARAVQFSVPKPSLFLMPGDLDGPPPPVGTPDFFVRQVDGDRFGGSDRLEVFAFSVNWANPATSTFVQVGNLATAPFDSILCSPSLLGACIPQPGVPQRLETLTVWPMWRLQYRNFGTYEGMVTNHTVDANGNDLAGVRWYELRRSPGGAWGIFQQGTYAPDSTHRWMGSVAMDRSGDIALGYSASSDSVFPSIRRVGRLVGDPPGTLPQPEIPIVVGNGAQTHPSSRWGNYSSMDVDPTDDCTFWYTAEYYDNTSVAGWKTKIASFGNSSCGERPPPPEGATGFEYAAKVVCGLQADPKDMRIVRGFYATAVNIHNPNDETAVFKKKLALTYPPEEEKPGKIYPIAQDKLRPDEALEVDCMDIEREVFPNGFPAKYIKGFVVVQSDMKLDVTAVYTAAGLDDRARVQSVTSVDVEQVLGRAKEKQPGQCPDLLIKDIGRPAVSCPGGAGTCVTKVDYTIANIGTADAGSFDVRSLLDPSQVVNQSVPAGLAAGATLPMTVATPPNGNCFDPDCTVSIAVDIPDKVPECNEQNNTKSNSTIG